MALIYVYVHNSGDAPVLTNRNVAFCSRPAAKSGVPQGRRTVAHGRSLVALHPLLARCRVEIASSVTCVMAHWRPAAVAAALVAMAVSWAGCAAAPEGIQPAPRTARASATHVGHASSPRSDTTVTMGKEPMKLSSTGPDYTLPSFFFMAGSEEGGALYGGYNYSGGLGEPDVSICDYRMRPISLAARLLKRTSRRRRRTHGLGVLDSDLSKVPTCIGRCDQRCIDRQAEYATV